MADVKITDFAALTNISDNAVLYVVSGGVDYKITKAELFKELNGLTVIPEGSSEKVLRVNYEGDGYELQRVKTLNGVTLFGNGDITTEKESFLQSRGRGSSFDTNGFEDFYNDVSVNSGYYENSSASQTTLALALTKETGECWYIWSSSAANSGCRFRYLSQTLSYEGLTMFFIVRPLVLTNVAARFGMVYSGQDLPSGGVSDGIYVEIINNQLTLNTKRGGVGSATSALTVDANSFLFIMVEVEKNNATEKLVRIKVRQNSTTGTVLLNQTITSNLPINNITDNQFTLTRFCFTQIRTTATTSAILSQLAFAKFWYQKPNFLNQF